MLPQLARAEQKTVVIPCPPSAVELPAGGLRAASDGDTWEFLLAPEAGVTVWDQQWTFGGLNPNATSVDPAWGSFGGGNGSNSLSWISPTAGGTYGIKVKAKRKCGGGVDVNGGDGPAIDENFEVNWNVDVEAVKTWTTPSALIATMASPAPNLLVAPSTPIACNVTAVDSDHWKIGDAPEAEEGDDADTLVYNWSASGGFLSGSGASTVWTPPNAGGTYSISCIVDDAPKELDSLDNGTRDDAPVTVSVSVIVPPRTWSTGASIGAVLDDKAKPVMNATTPLLNGRVLTPQDQTVPKPQGQNEYPVVKVRPGEDVACLVEAATDWDHWKREGVGEETDANFGSVHGDEKDEITYLWSASGGAWRDNKTNAAAATWKAPAAIQNAANEYTITCTLDDKPTAVTAPDAPVSNTARGDAPVARTIKVQVVDETSWMGLGVYRNQTDESPAVGPIGGTAYIAVDVQVGGQTTFAAPGAIRLRVQEHDGEGLHHEADNHAWLDAAETGWVEWEFDAANNGQNAHWKTQAMDLPRANGATTPRRFRKWVEWNTTEEKTSTDPDGADPATGGPLKAGKFWGHNASHTVELEYSVKLGADWIVKHEAEFQPNDGGDAKKAGPTRSGAEVGNLVINGVSTDTGTSDYFKFDPDADDSPLKNPTISFVINDADPHCYRWTVKVKDTRTAIYIDAATVKGTGFGAGEISFQLNKEALLANDSDALPNTSGAMGQDTKLTAWGTYSFDIFVKEFRNNEEAYVDGQNNIDYQAFRSPYKLEIPGTYTVQNIDEGGVVNEPGHEFFWESDGETYCNARVKYYLTDKDNVDASSVKIDLLSPELTTLNSLSNLPPTINAPHPAKGQDAYLLYSFPQGITPGDYIAVFSATDSHKTLNRDHENHSMLAVNQRDLLQPIVWLAGDTYGTSDWCGVWVKTWMMNSKAGVKTDEINEIINGKPVGVQSRCKLSIGRYLISGNLSNINAVSKAKPNDCVAAVNGMYFGPDDEKPPLTHNGRIGDQHIWKGPKLNRHWWAFGTDGRAFSMDRMQLESPEHYVEPRSVGSKASGFGGFPALIVNGKIVQDDPAYTGFSSFLDMSVGRDRTLFGGTSSQNFFMVHCTGIDVPGRNNIGWTWAECYKFMSNIRHSYTWRIRQYASRL